MIKYLIKKYSKQIFIDKLVKKMPNIPVNEFNNIIKNSIKKNISPSSVDNDKINKFYYYKYDLYGQTITTKSKCKYNACLIFTDKELFINSIRDMNNEKK